MRRRPEEVSEDVSEEVSEEVPEEVSDEVSEEVSDEVCIHTIEKQLRCEPVLCEALQPDSNRTHGDVFQIH